MRGLERHAGPLPPWVAAVHRNTQHPHVHIVMAARLEVSPDRFRTLVITRPRLARMKESLGQELSRQLERSPVPREHRIGLRELMRVDPEIEASPRRAGLKSRHRTGIRSRFRALDVLSYRLRRAARRYQRQIEQELLEEERRQKFERGWER